MSDRSDNALEAKINPLRKLYNRAAYALLALCVLNLIAWFVGVAMNGSRFDDLGATICRLSWPIAVALVLLSLSLVVVSRQRRPLWIFFSCFVAATILYVESFLAHLY